MQANTSLRRDSQVIGVFASDALNASARTFLSLSSFKRILRQQPLSRSAEDIRFLMEFTATVKFFQELGRETHFQCCQYMRYEFTPKGSFVFRKGDSGSAFYVILDGGCAVLVPTLLSNGKVEQTAVVDYGSGDTFGELALLKNSRRAASITCKIDTHFAVLEKGDFTRIIAKGADLVLAAKVDFLAKFPFLASVSHTSLQRASYYFTEKTYRHRQEVFRYGEAATHIFLIKEGTFEMQTTLPAVSKSRYTPSYTRKVGLTVLTQEQMFGEEDILAGSSRRNYTVVCESAKGVLLVVSKEDFFKRVCSEETLKVLQRWESVKSGFRLQRLSDLSIMRESELAESRSFIQTERRMASPEVRQSTESISDRRSLYEPSPPADVSKSTMRCMPSLSWDTILLKQQAEKRIRRSHPAHHSTINIHTQKLHKKRPNRLIRYQTETELPPIATALDACKLRHSEKDLYS